MAALQQPALLMPQQTCTDHHSTRSASCRVRPRVLREAADVRCWQRSCAAMITWGASAAVSPKASATAVLHH